MPSFFPYISFDNFFKSMLNKFLYSLKQMLIFVNFDISFKIDKFFPFLFDATSHIKIVLYFFKKLSFDIIKNFNLINLKIINKMALTLIHINLLKLLNFLNRYY